MTGEYVSKPEGVNVLDGVELRDQTNNSRAAENANDNDSEMESNESPVDNYPTGFQLVSIMIAICLAVFCVALDNTNRISEMDPLGNMLFLPSIICLLLALQWGGTTYPWASGRVIALFLLAGILVVAFCIVQIRLGSRATVPLSVASQRSIAFGSLFAFCIGAAFFLFVFYMPYYFQAIKNASALQSGIDVLPLILAQVVGTMVAGAMTVKLGYYMPFILLSVIFMAVGGGLLTMLETDSSTGTWIGYQIIFGLGTGLGFQQVSLAAQAVLELADVSTGVAIAMFIQLLGGAIFVSVGENAFTNQLVHGIQTANIPGLSSDMVIAAGATQIRGLVGAQYLGALLDAYTTALVHVYRVGLIVSCIAIVGAAGMEWVDVRGKELDAVSGV